MTTPLVGKIVSGGQTGADRAALDFAISRGIPHGGWCPRGRKAEDGPIPVHYRLTETDDRQYATRTRKNVLDSDGTVIFSTRGRVRGGTGLTMRLAREHGRPLLHLDAGLSVPEAAARLRAFVAEFSVRVLNVAGPRASQEPQVAEFVHRVLEQTYFQGVRDEG